MDMLEALHFLNMEDVDEKLTETSARDCSEEVEEELSVEEALTTDGKEIEGEFSEDEKTFEDEDGNEYPVNDAGEVIAEVSIEDDED